MHKRPNFLWKEFMRSASTQSLAEMMTKKEMGFERCTHPTWPSAVDVVTDAVDHDSILQASFDGTGDWRAILKVIELQPDTAYIC